MTAAAVSVIVPNYNYSESLDLCLRSILDQTYPLVEILVVDDCSTDDSIAVAQALGVRVVSTGVNAGCGNARNVGAANTGGEILYFVDSDVSLHRLRLRDRGPRAAAARHAGGALPRAAVPLLVDDRRG